MGIGIMIMMSIPLTFLINKKTSILNSRFFYLLGNAMKLYSIISNASLLLFNPSKL